MLALGPGPPQVSSKPRTATHLGFYRGPSARELRGVPGSFASESLLQHGAGGGMGQPSVRSISPPWPVSLETRALVAQIIHNKVTGAVPCRPTSPTVPPYRVSCLPTRFRAWRRRSLLVVRHVGSGPSDSSYTVVVGLVYFATLSPFS